MAILNQNLLTTSLALGLLCAVANDAIAAEPNDQISLSLNLRYVYSDTVLTPIGFGDISPAKLLESPDSSDSSSGDSLLWYDGFVIDDYLSADNSMSELTATAGTSSKRNSTGRFYPVIVVNVPEPATVSLVGMCGMALLLRRRRRFADSHGSDGIETT